MPIYQIAFGDKPPVQARYFAYSGENEIYLFDNLATQDADIEQAESDGFTTHAIPELPFIFFETGEEIKSVESWSGDTIYVEFGQKISRTFITITDAENNYSAQITR